MAVSVSNLEGQKKALEVQCSSLAAELARTQEHWAKERAALLNGGARAAAEGQVAQELQMLKIANAKVSRGTTLVRGCCSYRSCVQGFHKGSRCSKSISACCADDTSTAQASAPPLKRELSGLYRLYNMLAETDALQPKHAYRTSVGSRFGSYSHCRLISPYPTTPAGFFGAAG